MNFQNVKKALKLNALSVEECSSCTKDSHNKDGEKNVATGVSEDFENIETTIWLCLQCGHQVNYDRQGQL